MSQAHQPGGQGVCPHCRNFKKIDFSRPIYKPTIPDLRKTAAGGCARCKVILAGVSNFSEHFKGCKESDVTVFICDASPNQVLDVVVGRPRLDSDVPWQGQTNLELEFYSHTGKAFYRDLS